MGKRGPDPGSLVQFPQQSKELASLRAENERLRDRIENLADEWEDFMRSPREIKTFRAARSLRSLLTKEPTDEPA